MEEPSRAIGLKKAKDARGDEPAARDPSRENEPGGSNPSNENTECLEPSRENEPEGQHLRDCRTYETRRDFWDGNPEDGPLFGDVVAGNCCGMAHMSFESLGGDSSEECVEMLQPLLAVRPPLPNGLPLRNSGVRLAAMAPKSSKPKPPAPPSADEEAAVAAALARLPRSTPAAAAGLPKPAPAGWG